MTLTELINHLVLIRADTGDVPVYIHDDEYALDRPCIPSDFEIVGESCTGSWITKRELCVRITSGSG